MDIPDGEQTMISLPAKLVAGLAEQHRPVRRRDTSAYVEQYMIHCPACDGSTRHIVRPGDAPLLCSFAVALLEVGIDVTEPIKKDDL
ncbi:MAG TPA: hypothetical protein VGH72_33765 [Pseudonocardia sp.]|jgi:hypothetical protein